MGERLRPPGSTEFDQIHSLMPEWLFIEATYANKKYQGRNPQESALEGGLKAGSPAYQDIYNYLGRFMVFYGNSEVDTTLLLNASLALGKLAETARALLSAANQQIHGFSLAEVDGLTLSQFEKSWFSLKGLSDFPIDYEKILVEMTESHIETIRAEIENPDKTQQNALDLLVDQAKTFGSFTLHASVMAAPGTPPEDWPHAWDSYVPMLH